MMARAVGLAGAGAIAPYHVDAVRALRDVRLVGVTDVDGARSQALAQSRPGTVVFGSLAELCAAGADIVHVLTPPDTHAAVAIEALERGCDVLVEKPLATSVADCDRIVGAARASGRRIGVDHSLLHDPWIARLRTALGAGRIGAPVSAEYACTGEYPAWGDGPVPPPYRDGGYPFRDLGVHGLYLLRACLGEIEHVAVERRAHGRDPNLAFDDWHVLVRCARGTGTIRLSWCARPLETSFVVRGERGVLEAEVGRMFLGRRIARGLPTPLERTCNTIEDAAAALVAVPRSALRLATGRLRAYEGLRAAVAAFHRALADGTPLPASLEDGRAVVRWVEEVARPADLAKIHRAWRHAPRRRGVELVTGASGRLGRALTARLLADGRSVRAFVRREGDAGALRHPALEVVLGDLGDAAAVSAAVEHATTVYHLGAAMGGGAEEHARATVAGTRHVVESCLAHGVRRLVHASSLSVLHWAGLDGQSGVAEDAPHELYPHARGRYTQAKLVAEETVMAAVRAHGLAAVVVRPGQIVGPDFLDAGAVDGVRLGRWLVVLGPAATPLPLVHVDDVVEALVRAAHGWSVPGTVYHLVDDRTVTRRALARAVGRVTGARVVCVPRPLVSGLARICERLAPLAGREAPLTRYRVRSAGAAVRFDCARAAAGLGWRPAAPALIPASGGAPDSASAAARSVPEADRPTPSPVPGDARAAAAR